MIRDILKAYDINYDMGVQRFLQDNTLYEEMLTSFLSDDCYKKAYESYKAHDMKVLFEQTHALKGVAGNLDMTTLYHTSSDLTEYLRHNENPDFKRVDTLFFAMEIAYQRVIEGITKASI